MALRNPYAAYANNKMMTASPAASENAKTENASPTGAQTSQMGSYGAARPMQASQMGSYGAARPMQTSQMGSYGAARPMQTASTAGTAKSMQISPASANTGNRSAVAGYGGNKSSSAAAYANSKIMTASPAELTLLLYDGAIKFCNIAIVAAEKKDIEKAHNHIIKTERIINEFRNSLDHKYPVAKDFDNVYVYLLRRLHEANIKKDPEILEEVLKHLRTMRDTWKEVMRLNAGSKVNVS